MDTRRSLGVGDFDLARHRKSLRRYLNLKLAALGLPAHQRPQDVEFLDVAHDLLANYQEQNRLLSGHLSPVDRRIQNFLDAYSADLPAKLRPKLPGQTLTLDHHGLARQLSLPAENDYYKTDELESYRVRQGVLHNPRNDRRTTKGVFHVAAGGLPVPSDKKEVPKQTWGALITRALRPPEEKLILPYTAEQNEQAKTWVSLLLRPAVVPEVPGRRPRRSMEIRFFVPGGLVANLDFVESIFGNAGDPYLPENDAGLDSDHWTGTSGCVILATHLVGIPKKELGLPHIDQASERERHDGMCWSSEDEPYNDGLPFKICARDERGVMVTVIADNYFGYCKKEVKTQISFSANLFGMAEEEHAGGALAFPSYNLGESFRVDSRVLSYGQTFAEVVERYGTMLDVKADGYAIDKHYDSVIYVPEDAQFCVEDGHVCWPKGDQRVQIPLLSKNIYIYPSGYKVRLEPHPYAKSWRLIGTRAEGMFCHKPCTVSGGGKSEISKSLSDAIIYGPIFVQDFESDMALVQELFDRDFSDRQLPELRQDYSVTPSRPILSEKRTLGSVIKLFTPSPDEFTPEYNAWLETVPNYIKALAFIIKRFYKPEWGDDWKSQFSVDKVNGREGHELRFAGRRLMASYLRVGVDLEASWQTHKLRQDFVPAIKVQMEDDISASIIVPIEWLPNYNTDFATPSVKLVDNCESRFFQRPDEAINRGFDHQAEADLAGPDVFISNFQPLTRDHARSLTQQELSFSAWTQPMQDLIRGAADSEEDCWVVSSAHPRIVDGKPSKNPRYLQTKPSLVDGRERYVGEVGARLLRRVPLGEPVIFPVHAVLPGRRNNPVDREAGIRPLAVYAPIHYQELPELFMDFICSLTGKSPSTTGAGSEGALTKGPFNALRATADLNAALIGMILCGYNGYSTAAGWIGSHRRVDHDISLLIPELWCRMSAEELQADRLIAEGFFEKVDDFTHEGETVLASRLGYRMTDKFVHTYLGRIFDHPDAVFDDDMLRPETQGLDDFVDGINNIVEAQQRVAQAYIDDGAIEEACPPLKVLIEVMATGTSDGKTIDDPSLRAMFTREAVIESDWYRERLLCKQQRDVDLWERHVAALGAFLKQPGHEDEVRRLNIQSKLLQAEATLRGVKSLKYLQSLIGTIGADPLGQGSGESLTDMFVNK